ncbi:hypothetical protein ACOZXQ_004131 [Cronobacter malonaticus]
MSRAELLRDIEAIISGAGFELRFQDKSRGYRLFLSVEWLGL